MGGVPMLLMMIAAAGVTYGWQPDKSGDQATAVEYIVQVTPHELAQIEQIGEISSVIDPEVRGYVSRVVIRVGTGTPPWTLPKALAEDRVALLKPDPQAGSGFSMPSSLQQSANNAAANTTNALRGAVDQAGRDIAAQGQQSANNLLDRIRGTGQNADDRAVISPPSTRSTNSAATNNSPFAAPALPGSTDLQNNYAQARSGGPSTDPTTSRDNAWDRYGANPNLAGTSQPRTTAQSNTRLAAGPTTADRNAQSAASRNTQSRSATGLGPSDTFGRMPSGLSDPTTRDYSRNQAQSASVDDRSRTGYEDLDSRSGLGDQGIYTQIGQTQQDFAGGRTNTQYNGFDTAASQNRDLIPANRSSQTATSNSGQSQYSVPSFADRTQSSSRLQARNPNLTNAEIAAGGWDFDAYNRLIDRNGNVIPEAASQLANQATGSNLGNTTATDAWLREAQAAQSNANRTSSNPYLRYDDPRRVDTSTNLAGDATSNYNPSLQNPPSQNSGNLNWPNTASNPLSNRDMTTAALGGNGSPNLGYPNQAASMNANSSLNGNGPLMTNYANGQNQPAANDYRYPNTQTRDPSGYSPNGYGTANGYPSAGGYPSQSFDNSAAIIAARQPSPQDSVRSTSPPSVDPVSMSDLGTSSATRTRQPIERPKQVAAQPLFNGLLLVSFVANIYLLFWLKRIRLQFRDLVAAKRVANSASVSAS
ncbi:hypothetical protein Pla22_05220 [Rubripirellula amarantea]|uniref:Uncharacterized protein n=1 Tax=Rubripirellula amarantea TaxID=2527999 RepID=A0A5C5WPU3_9BACT|nr:hypothetical protein [Rubripirellula amarantea]TWT52894.1 hypothetical protein Pla22_05220 [Rubripirellula amarantea]